MRATMYGCEIVWPKPIGSAASSKARRRSRLPTKASRGTRSSAWRTSSSTMSRPRSWCSTISRRARSGSSGRIGERPRIGGQPHPEVRERERGHVRDAPRDASVEPDRQERALGVGRVERAVAPPAEMAAPGEVEELHARRGRDEHVARVRVGERAPCALERVGLIEDREVAAGPPPAVLEGDAQLLAASTGHRLAVLAVEDDARSLAAVEPARELCGLLAAAWKPVDLPGPVGRGHDQVLDALVRGLERHRLLDARLAVVRARDHGVALEE